MPTTIDGGTVTTDDVESQETAGVHDAANYDGADGGKQIQAAIDDLSSRGGTVIIPPDGPDQGEWYLNELLAVPSNVRLRGSPGETTLSVQSAGGQLKIGGATNRTSNVVVAGVALNGNGFDSGRISVGKADHVTIRQCISRNGKYAFHVTNATDVVVDRCYGYGASDDNYTVTDYNQGSSLSRQVIVRDSVSEAPSQSCYEVDDGPQNIRFVDNHAIGGSYGYRTHTHSDATDEGAPKDIHFVRCRTDGASSHGYLFGANRVGSPEGYHVRDATVRGAGVTAFGRTLRGSGTEVGMGNLTVDGLDIMRHNGSGPAIDIPADVYTGRVMNARVSMESASGVVNCRGADLTNFTFSDLFITGQNNAQWGVDVSGRGGGVKRNVTISQCVIQGCRQNGIDARAYDADIRECNIDDNIIRYNGQDTTKGDALRSGILTSANTTGVGADYLHIGGNQCYDGGTPTQTYGIFREGIGDSVVMGNILHGNALGSFGGDGTTTTGVEQANVT